MDNDDIKEFADSDELSNACSSFCKKIGINDWMGFCDTVTEYMRGIDR